MKPVIRTAHEKDMALVLSSWSRDAYELTRDRPALYTLFRPLFETVQARLLSRTTILVAVNPEDDEQIFGCIVFERASVPVLHHVFVKHAFRRNGLARELLREAGIRPNKPAVYSLRTALKKLIPKCWTFVPYGLMP